MNMKTFRLFVHQKGFSDDDLVININDTPEYSEGDIIEIYNSHEEDNPRLLLQIKPMKEELLVSKGGLVKDTISIESSIAQTFGLRQFTDVTVSLVNPSDVALDSVELTFKDQYLGRSEMWRLKNSLRNTCAYLNKKIEFCSGAVRCQVYEMWSFGNRVACGVITDDTKIVFRSSTSMVYLFLQMSSEMWDFDIYGDLYFEKAVNGFLADLFMKWKKNGSNHEVTIVLFSRTFYEAKSLDEFPEFMRECLQKDYRGRYYEDFYRVAVQNERYDDWNSILAQLRRVFSKYLMLVLEYHKKSDGQPIPKATNSTAAQGNFLEVLNMSLNVFEKHYLDRSFDRTGQLSVVITPGVGVFEVDRELTNITKQRIIDNGVGSDLVCVGEQPLHAVPLLKFHNKDTHKNVPDDYSMPHWINLSFYSTNKKAAYTNFIPRIKIPPEIENNSENDFISYNLLQPDEEYIHNSYFDYDAYDAQVFQLPPVHPVHDTSFNNKSMRYKRTSGIFLEGAENGQRRKMSDPDIQHPICDNNNRSQPITIQATATSPVVSPIDDKSWNMTLERDPSPPLRMVVGSEGSPPMESRALINPFDPSHVTIKLTSNRRRWTHIFPKGPTGVLIQQHHYQAVPTNTDKTCSSDYESGGSDSTPSRSRNSSSSIGPHYLSRSVSSVALQEYCRKRSGHRSSQTPVKNPSKSIALLWGATGEQEWTPALTTAVNDIIIGVDWKSLTIPACLPITTDYFPDKRSLQTDYLVSLYNLLPDDVNADYAQQRAIYKEPLTTMEVFKELISQRLAQGFQLILLSNNVEREQSLAKSASTVIGTRPTDTETETYLLSIGRLFHKISLAGNNITVIRYRPRHPYPGFKYQYRYRFHAPHHDTYEESFASFDTEKLEHYNWNYLDHYICTRGDTDFVVDEGLKYWRFRVFMLPLNNPATKRVVEDSQQYCDIYTQPSAAENQQLIEGFLKFIETIVNKFKRIGISKKPRNATQGNSPFRERLGSNRLPERSFRPRSGSKVLERGRVSPAVDFQIENQSQENGEENGNHDPLLRATANYYEIIDAMKQPHTGVGFLSAHQSVPTATFVSADAVNWLINHMEGVTTQEQATQILTSMQKEKLICHASGNFEKPFLYGFYLYHIVNVDKEDPYSPPLGDLQSFENEWVEVEVQPALNWGLTPPSSTGIGIPNACNERENGVPHFLCVDINSNYQQGDIDLSVPLYKRTHLEIDVFNKSDRVEWGHARYQTVYRPDQAYELVVEWLTASGTIVAELLNSWARKAAQSCGLQMIPIPHDPLALPYSSKSDPLRGPIFVPLNIKCLEGAGPLFNEFREETASERLFLLQEAIIARFGFMSCLMEPQNVAQTQEHQYIHCTGTVFILIACPAPRSRQRVMSMSRQKTSRKYNYHADVMPSPHEAYITRHVSGKNKDDYDNTRKMGFLWSWNHMISRRWRSFPGVDNKFQMKLLKDFKDFCANKDQRLRNYWDSCWRAKELASIS